MKFTFAVAVLLAGTVDASAQIANVAEPKSMWASTDKFAQIDAKYKEYKQLKSEKKAPQELRGRYSKKSY